MGICPDQVQMIWPDGRAAPEIHPPSGYHLRPWQPEDENPFYELMASVGWNGWDREKLAPWLVRILPEGWYFAFHKDSGALVGTCMATHDPTWMVPFCGEVGWTAVHPEHQSRGLGAALVAAVLGRFLQAGYRTIHLYTEIWRTAALKMYLKTGFLPFLEPPETRNEWEVICRRIDRPFKPDNWPVPQDLIGYTSVNA